ncbi:MAG: N-acetyltransferase [Chloroflexota bacterium]
MTSIETTEPTESTEPAGQNRLPDPATAPAIRGLRVRPFRDRTDYARLAELQIAANQHDGIPYLPTASMLEVEMEGADGARSVDDVVVIEVDGQPVAAAGVERVVREVPQFQVWGSVDPVWRRHGLGTWLMAWTIAHATDRAVREDPDGRVELASFAEDAETGHRALLAATGFAPVRHFFLMKRTGLDEAPDVPLPDGFEIRTVTEAHRRSIVEAENEAFRDHWGHREMTESTYGTTFGRPELDTDLWVVAWAGDEIAGVVQNWIWPEENERLGVRRGWLEHISVRRPWRRQGLARAITAASLVRLREAGQGEAMLGVDSENPNGALGLYEGLGFEVVSRAAAYRRDLQS